MTIKPQPEIITKISFFWCKYVIISSHKYVYINNYAINDSENKF